MSGQRSLAQNLLNANGEILGGRYDCAEILQLIKVLVVEAIQNFAGYGGVQSCQIADHSGFWRERTAHCDLKKIVMPVPVRVVAFAISLAIDRVGQCCIVQAVGSRERIAAGEIYLHRYSP